jgi:molecular chaperone GrpE
MSLKDFIKKLSSRIDHIQVEEGEEVSKPVLSVSYENKLVPSDLLYPVIETEEQIEEDNREENKKVRLTRQFRTWLDSFDPLLEDIFDRDVFQEGTDLYTLFSEITALKSEVKRQSRQVQTTLEDYHSAVELIQSGLETFQKERESSDAEKALIRQDIEQMTLRMIVMEILDVRDRIEDGLRLLKKRKPSFVKRLFRIKESITAGVIEGQEMILGRVDRMLYAHGVTPIEALDRKLEPHLMRAIDVDTVEDKEDGVVLEEIRKGFMLNNDILRVAEVKVNKQQPPEVHKSQE